LTEDPKEASVTSGSPDEMVSRIAADSPVGVAGDELGRSRFAELIAKQIELSPVRDGLVMSLVGEWGSGKSSVLDMVAEQFRGGFGHQSTGEVVVVRFNPWFFSGSEQLISLFFAALAEQLKRQLSRRRTRAVASRLRSYGEALGTIRALPVVGGFFGVGSDVLAEAARRTGAGAGLPEQRARLAEDLRKLGVRVLVLVDDVDRLAPDETRDLMRMVKLVGDLPAITYLLAFDPEPVTAALKAEGIDGRQYLEKIVQVEHRLPAIPADRLDAMLRSAIQSAIAGLPDERLDGPRWDDVRERIIRPLVRTPRHVRRYANGLALAIALAGEEVDLVDVLALAAVATFMPDFHEALPSLLDTLTPGLRELLIFELGDRKEQARARLVEVAEKSGHKEVALATYELLFPQAGALVGDPYMTRHGDAMEDERRRRVANSEAFLAYLTATIPEEGVSVAEVRRILDAFENGDELRRELEGRGEEDLGRLFSRLQAHTKEVPAEWVPQAIRVISRRARELGGPVRQVMGAPVREMERFNAALLSELDRDTRREVALAWFAEESGVLGKLAVVEVVQWSITHGEPLLDEETLSTFRSDLAKLVLGTAPDELVALSDLGRLLWLAADHLKDDDLPALHALLADDRLFARFLLIYTEPSFHGQPRPLAWGNVGEVVGQEWLIDRVRRADVTALTGELREVVETASRFANKGQDEG
jgi:predicted KAP-like P-loop ATPase